MGSGSIKYIAAIAAVATFCCSEGYAELAGSNPNQPRWGEAQSAPRVSNQTPRPALNPPDETDEEFLTSLEQQREARRQARIAARQEARRQARIAARQEARAAENSTLTQSQLEQIATMIIRLQDASQQNKPRTIDPSIAPPPPPPPVNPNRLASVVRQLRALKGAEQRTLVRIAESLKPKAQIGIDSGGRLQRGDAQALLALVDGPQ